jgi:LDH2 family malate/lactate/ureidoglycolate dehydrogenase
VLTPGEPERARRAERLRDGLPVPAPTLEAILTLGRALGLEDACDAVVRR